MISNSEMDELDAQAERLLKEWTEPSPNSIASTSTSYEIPGCNRKNALGVLLCYLDSYSYNLPAHELLFPDWDPIRVDGSAATLLTLVGTAEVELASLSWDPERRIATLTVNNILGALCTVQTST